MSENIRMQVKANGSIRVTGTVDFVNVEGHVVTTKTDFSLCRCGHSNEKPFCDGSHRANNFQAPAFDEVAPEPTN
jgi:CDGSH-type Zn-finger protein